MKVLTNKLKVENQNWTMKVLKKFAGLAFVQFNTNEMLIDCLSNHKPLFTDKLHRLIKKWLWCMKLIVEPFRINEKILKIHRVPAPTDIIWENMTTKKRIDAQECSEPF